MTRSAVNPRPSVSPYGAGAPGALPRLLPVGLTSLDGHLARYGQLPRWAPGELIAEVDRAGLTGRGGAGFPTARKLAAVSARRNPGADAASTTRAITIGVPAHHVWPWLAQLGYGRAGWYSYDWLDNDGQPSARRIQPEWQQLRPGDRILMMPGSGFDVAEVQDGHYFTARAPDQAMSWCLAVEPADQGSCRVISRWRARWHVTPASAAWIALSEPGAFIMERRMLLGIRARAEQAARPGLVQRR